MTPDQLTVEQKNILLRAVACSRAGTAVFEELMSGANPLSEGLAGWTAWQTFIGSLDQEIEAFVPEMMATIKKRGVVECLMEAAPQEGCSCQMCEAARAAKQ